MLMLLLLMLLVLLVLVVTRWGVSVRKCVLGISVRLDMQKR